MQDALSRTLSLLGRETTRIVLHAPCVVCGEELPWRDRKASCCSDCWSALPLITTATCRSCALPWSGADRNHDFLCLACQGRALPLDWSDAWGHYRDGLESLIHAFKFKRQHFLAPALSTLLEETMGRRNDCAFDAIVPVPMHRAKRRRRGYNQAELLARALALRIDVPVCDTLLTKPQERETQSLLARDARAKNVRGAFVASENAAGLSILLIDDVCTTGETLRACATALKKKKASRVCALSLAKTDS